MFSAWRTPQYESHDERAKYVFNVKKEPIFAGVLDPRQVKDRFAIVRTDTGAPLSVVSNRYQPVLHSDVIASLDARFKQQAGFFERRTALEHGGAKMLIEYRFPDTSIEVRPGDRVMLTLLGGNSFDTSTAVWMSVGAFRLICTNGAMIGKIIAFIRNRHTLSFDLNRVTADLGGATEQFKQACGKWKQYAATPFPLSVAYAFLNRVVEEKTTGLTEKQAAAILTQFATPITGVPDRTLWGFYNAITSVASHQSRGKAPIFALLKNANVLTEQAEESIAA